MPFGGSDGQYYDDHLDYLLSSMPAQPLPEGIKKVWITGDKNEKTPEDLGLSTEDKPIVKPEKIEQINRNRQDSKVIFDDSGNIVDYDLFDAFKRPPEAPTEPRGELNPDLGTGVAPTTPEASTGFLGRLSIVNALKGMTNPTMEDTSLIRGFYESVKSALKLPGDVYGGKIDPMSQQGIERAAELAGLMIGGPAPVAAKMADGTLGSFAGVRSRTFDKEALVKAQELETKGIHPDTIWSETGTFRGADERWRQEISDHKAVVHPDALDKISSSYSHDYRLGHIFDHPDLYDAYPWAKNIKVRLDGGRPNTASYSTPDTIRFGENMVNKSVILHEVQHAIQDREGFAQGGAPAKNFALNYEKDLNKHRKDFFALRDKLDADPYKIITAQEMEQLKKYQKIFELDAKRQAMGVVEARANYLRLAGEVESRNTETRMLLDDIDRRMISPLATEDTPRAQQLVTDVPIYTTPYGMTHNPSKAPIP